MSKCPNCNSEIIDLICSKCGLEFNSLGDIDCTICNLNGKPLFKEYCGDCEWEDEEDV